MTSRAPRNVGGLVTTKTALRPQSSSGAASYGLAGLAINRSDFQSMLLKVVSGAKSGSPTTVTVKAKVQHCDTEGGTYTDVATGPANTAVAISDITDQNQERFLELDLSGFKEFLKVAFEVSFTGGSSPAVLLAAEAVLGGGPVIPSAHG